MQYDVFISHASVDKEAVARPLSEALQACGLSVWLDEEQLQVGDSIRRGIDQALVQSRFGVVILSPAYLESEWTRKELDALFTKEKHQSKTILPVSHQLGREAIEGFSPMLSDKITLSTDDDVEVLADRILASMWGEADEEAISSPADNSPTRRWVWRCTDESLECNQVSVLSLLETVWALGLYYFLARYFQYHWWLLLTALAAPIILLRSEHSIELGVRLLRSYTNRNEKDISQLEKIIIIILTASASFVLSYWLAKHWLGDHQGWVLLWRATLVGFIAVAVAVAVSVSVAIAGAGAGAHAFAGAGAFAGASTVAGAGAFVGVLAGAVVGAGAFATATAGASASAGAFAGAGAGTSKLGEFILLALFFPFFGLGIWLHSLSIRVWATLNYPLSGLKNLPSNWFRISICLDFTHLPELLPKAIEVNELFSLKGLLKAISGSDFGDRVTGITLAPIWYIPALLWRWSLKATLWLWWPLAFALKQPFNTDNMYQIRQAVVTIVSGWWKWLLLPVVIVIPWLLSSYYPEIGGLVNVLPDQVDKPFDKLIGYAVPPPHSLRYAAIWLACILSIVVWWKANQLKSQFPMVIGDETYSLTIENDPKLRQIKQDFYQRAESIAKWHTIRIVSFILLGYSYILYLANAWYPEQASRFIAEWLIPYL